MNSTQEATPSALSNPLPATGRWTLDPGHTSVEFVGRHFMLTKVRGRFRRVEGVIDVGATPEASSVVVTIDVASVESGLQERDDHLRSSDFFDVEHHPTATFRSTDVDWRGGSGHVTGDLTIVGITRPVTVDVDLLGQVADPWGGHRAVFSASTEIDREAWGLTWNVALDTGECWSASGSALRSRARSFGQSLERPGRPQAGTR